MSKFSFKAICSCLVLVALLGSSAVTSIAHAADAVVQVLKIPDGGTHPQAQADAAGRLHLIYFKGDSKQGDIYYVRSGDGGGTFTPPIRVNSHPESAIITGTIRGPHLAIGKNNRPHVAWMGSHKAQPKAGTGKDTPMLYARLNDAGNAFEPQRNVIQKNTGLDGGGSVAADSKGNVYVVWHAPEGGDDRLTEADRQVWVTRSKDDGATFDPEVSALPEKTGVCACCGLNVSSSDNGQVVIAYRTATEMVNRDVHLLRSKDFGKTFEVVNSDPWKIGKCVMSTAAFASHGNRTYAAWETKEEIHFAVVPAVSPAVVETVPGAGKNRKHPSVAINANGQVLIAWTEGTAWNKGGTVRWQLFDADGQPVANQSGQFGGLTAWSVPAAVATKDGSFRIAF